MIEYNDILNKAVQRLLPTEILVLPYTLEQTSFTVENPTRVRFLYPLADITDVNIDAVAARLIKGFKNALCAKAATECSVIQFHPTVESALSKQILNTELPEYITAYFTARDATDSSKPQINAWIVANVTYK